MFTGIVEEIGEIVGIEPVGDDAARLTVRGSLVTSDAEPGDSISVDGVCLTVVDTADGRFTADVMAETLARTALGEKTRGSKANLERAMPVGGRFGGHIMQGHIDGTGTVLTRMHTEHWDVVRIGLEQPALVRYIAPKGSIAIDGVSLTVVEVDDGPDPSFTVSLIPTTLGSTTLGEARDGVRVNLEVDVLAKYVERLMAGGA